MIEMEMWIYFLAYNLIRLMIYPRCSVSGSSMHLTLRKRLLNGSYRNQLTVSIAVGVAALVIATSLVSGWIMADRLREELLTESVQLTDQFASQSVFTFLVDDPSEAFRTLDAIQAFSGITYVALLNEKYEKIASTGDHAVWRLDDRKPPHASGAQLVGEDSNFWHFVGTVQTLSKSSPVGKSEQKSELLGYIQISVAKAPLIDLIQTIVFINFVVALVVAALLIAWLTRRVRLLTDPLQDLARVMLDARLGAEDIRATLAGPEEARNIGRVFNELMGELEKHKRSLESEVTIRTRELRQARDQAFSAHRHKNEFMASVTHEMRSPLHAITSYVQLTINELEFLKESATVDNIRQHQGVIILEANNLLVRINQILELARVEAGRREIKLSETNLEDVLKDVEKTVGPLAVENNNALEIQLKGHPIVIIDKDMLQQIILNVLSNACKFTEHGDVLMSARRDNKKLSIEVRDSGIGIPEDEQPQVFDAFRQVDMSDTRRYRGTGLGLAIARQFCELLGGTIDLDSTVGEGTIVTIMVPLPTNS